MESKYITNKSVKNPCLIGGKGYSLLKLKENGINVPNFFILNTNAFDLFKRTSSKAATINTSNIISGNIKLPKAISNKLISSYSKYIKKGKVAVRSSATVEDSSKQSYAGNFKTNLFVAKKDLLKSVKEVYESINTLNSIKDKSEIPKMAVVVQKQIDSDKSGVLFITKDYVIINAIIGQGERFVSGKEKGDSYKIELNKKEYNPIIVINPQKYANIKGHNERLPIQASYSQKLLNYEIKKLVNAAIKVYNIFGSPQDIEWCIKGNNIFILQSRPITSDLPKLQFSNKKESIPVSEGISNGIPRKDVKNIPKVPVIIVKEEIELGDIKYLVNKNVVGIISKYDGMLSHVSILARELKIPYITWVNDIDRILNSKEVYMNGGTGEIKIKGKSGKLLPAIGNALPTFKWVHKNIKNISYSKEGRYLMRKSGKFAILYYKDGNDLTEIKSKDFSNYIILSGLSDIYSSYGLLFRSIKAKVSGIKQIKESFVRALDTKSTEKLLSVYNDAKGKMIEHYENAKSLYKDYNKSKDINYLVDAYINSVKAYIYFNAIRNAAFDYAEYIYGLEMSSKSNLISDSELYKSFWNTGKGKLINLRKELISMLNDISNTADENTSYSMIDLEEQISSDLKKEIGIKKYNKITKDNFG